MSDFKVEFALHDQDVQVRKLDDFFDLNRIGKTLAEYTTDYNFLFDQASWT